MRKASLSFVLDPKAMPSHFWNRLSSVLSLPVSIIFTALYHFSIISSDWKTAILQPLFKKNDPSIVSNYRPISLPSLLCKIMETTKQNNLLNFAIS